MGGCSDEHETSQAWVKEHCKGHSFILLLFLLTYVPAPRLLTWITTGWSKRASLVRHFGSWTKFSTIFLYIFPLTAFQSPSLSPEPTSWRTRSGQVRFPPIYSLTWQMISLLPFQGYPTGQHISTHRERFRMFPALSQSCLCLFLWTAYPNSQLSTKLCSKKQNNSKIHNCDYFGYKK